METSDMERIFRGHYRKIFNTDTTTEILYLGKYHPYLSGVNPHFDEFSRSILALKNEAENALVFFYSQIEPVLRPSIAITAVPPHDPDQNSSGIRVLARQLAQNARTDATSCLVRHTKIDRLATGGNRSIERHLGSIRVNDPDRIKYRRVLLLDDIATSGNSLLACRQLLLESGSKTVICMALGRTG